MIVSGPHVIAEWFFHVLIVVWRNLECSEDVGDVKCRAELSFLKAWLGFMEKGVGIISKER
jgi:hypothetical protein